MGKARAATATAESSKYQDNGSEKIGLSPAIREGFRALPEAVSSRSRDTTAALKKWIVSTYPHLAEAVESATFSSTLANQRKKAEGTSSAAPVRSKAPAAESTEPTFPEVLKAKGLATDLKQTPEKLLALLDALEEFGDATKLKKALAYAKELK